MGLAYRKNLNQTGSVFHRDRPVPFEGIVRVGLWIPALWLSTAGMTFQLPG